MVSGNRFKLATPDARSGAPVQVQLSVVALVIMFDNVVSLLRSLTDVMDTQC